MAVDHYSIDYIYGLEQTVGRTETAETHFELLNLDLKIFTFTFIVAVNQGMFGPQVCVGISTGTVL